MKKACLLTVLGSTILFLFMTGCTDPTQPPVLASLVPNPVNPLTTPQNLDFLGSNMEADVCYILDTGSGQIQLEPENIPGVWTFRCVFGFHFIYTFDSLADFLDSVGSASSIDITAYNVGVNGIPEDGLGDDLSSQAQTWLIEY